MKKNIKALFASATIMATSVMPAFAATVGDEGKFDLSPKDQYKALAGLTFPKVVAGLISFALVIASLIFFFMLIIGGIQWMLSGGDKAGTEAARGRITAALIGLVVVFSAWAIAQLINAMFGVNVLQFNITPMN